jgi:Ca2+-transporting ATPase
MEHHPRPRSEGVITRRMWRNIFITGAVIAMSTLFVLDASLPGGFVRGSHDLRYAQTMAFTTLVVAQLLNVFNARSDERSAFVGLFTNRWLWGAIVLSSAQALVLYVPAMQKAFGTVGLDIDDWVRCTVAASMVVWISELLKIVERRLRRQTSPHSHP